METWTGTKPELDDRVARRVAEHLRRTLRDRPHAVMGLVGGRSVGGIYAALAREESRGGHHRTDFPREAASAVHSVQLRALGDGVARVPVGVPEVRAAVLGSSA